MQQCVATYGIQHHHQDQHHLQHQHHHQVLLVRHHHLAPPTTMVVAPIQMQLVELETGVRIMRVVIIRASDLMVLVPNHCKSILIIDEYCLVD